ncbi:LAME_0F05644g1_1 [Lachancea meyersii CBS 8951]|uniref:LAME_0F05644g1_1 n=1 Tax=Lachancea meyersii CBS 8951 TaxID=1266667 RepID=A0A1G4JSX9_9SACH|nr:LAME_0F05644g1_1 [Lachancea meyersii CBS 8951]
MGLIQKIAIIGGGPAGLIAAESLARQKGQNWEIVGFEARGQLGGVWGDSPGSNTGSREVFEQLRTLERFDEPLDPSRIFQEGSALVKNGRISDLRPLLATSVDKPMRVKRIPQLRDGFIFSAKTGVYENLMTNTPGELMNMDLTDLSHSSKRDDIAPLEDLQQVQEDIRGFVEKNPSSKVFRRHTYVEYLDKLSPEKWILVAKRSEPDSENDYWYSDTFDAVIIANGHFLCPYLPFYMTSNSDDGNNIHEFNKRFPKTLTHVRDLDVWFRERLPVVQKDSATSKQKVVIVGKSFSAMDILKRLIPLQDANHDLEIIVSVRTPPMPDNQANPFRWFDRWLTQTAKVTTVCAISRFFEHQGTPALQLEDGTVIQDLSAVVFATGYVYTFPFVSNKLLESYRILVTPDPRNTNGTPSNVSRVTGLYLHTFSIADPTMGFVGISSNANFQSFHISALALSGTWAKLNTLYDSQNPKDGPIYDSIWSQVLPSIQEQLQWARERLLRTGNNGAYHFYYPVVLLKQQWLQLCEPLFSDEARQHQLFPHDSAEKAQRGLERLEDLFFKTVDPEELCSRGQN